VLAEELGYARAWIYDSAPLWEDPFVHLALAAERTALIGLGTAVLIPDQRSVMTMASGIATIARISSGRFRACFGTGFTARLAVGQRPMTLNDLSDYVTALRQLLAGGYGDRGWEGGPDVARERLGRVAADQGSHLGQCVRPRGAALAGDVADGIVGPPHPTLPAAMIVSGTVLDSGEEQARTGSERRSDPWRVIDWHNAYAQGVPRRSTPCPAAGPGERPSRHSPRRVNGTCGRSKAMSTPPP